MKVFTYWEGPSFPHIDVCRKSMERALRDVEFHYLTPETLGDWLKPGVLHPAYREVPKPGNRADCVRAALLAEHGGWWLDADTIALRSPQAMNDANPNAEALYFVWDKPPIRASNGYIYMRKGSPMAAAWLAQINAALAEGKRCEEWQNFGEKIITPMLLESPNAIRFDCRLFLPIDIDSTVETFFEAGDWRKYVQDDTIAFGLNHSYFVYWHPDAMAVPPEKWNDSPLLVHQLFHAAHRYQNCPAMAEPEPPIKASICLATYDKPFLMRAVLESIFKQKPPFAFEVIVVDDGSPTMDTKKICDDFPVQYHRLERAPGFRNPCIARNAAYRLARGDVIIAQSEVAHISPNTIQLLVEHLKPGTFVLAHVFCIDPNGNVCGEYTGPERRAPYFFLGSLYRKDLYAIGGNDEDFAIAPSWDDNWFGDCLMYGQQLKPVYDTSMVGHHLYHPTVNDLSLEPISRKLYWDKHKAAARGEGKWCSSGGPWPFVPNVPLTIEAVFNDINERTGFVDATAGVSTESKSGVGSGLESTAMIRAKLSQIVQRTRTKVFLDLCCGDFYWLSHVNLGVEFYIGADIVNELVKENIAKYAASGRQFIHFNMLTSPAPNADLTLCRDAIVHLSFADAKTAIQNICAGGGTYLLATTFPEKGPNRDITTGGWSPYNMQKPPFNFPPPIEIINEGCREHYPKFTDKSLGLWKIADIAKVMGIRAVGTRSLVVCVEYDDFLRITLPRNKRHFFKTLVVTSPEDERTQAVAKEFGCECFVTDAFQRNDAFINKGLAMEEALDELGRDGWICTWDADIVMPESIRIPKMSREDLDCLWVPVRHILENPKTYTDGMDWNTLPCPTLPDEFDGYMQLFNAASRFISRPWYGTRWTHAGGGDSDFESKFPVDKRRRPPWRVLHLGPEGIPELRTRIGRNWMGRTTPRLDTGEVPAKAKERLVAIEEMVSRRREQGTGRDVLEKTEMIADMPRRISFFWNGRLSWMRYLTLKTFRMHNPDWEICLYRPETSCASKQWSTPEVGDEAYAGEDYSNHLDEIGVQQLVWKFPVMPLGPAQACDLLGWQILSTTGGFYADMDILWLKPMESVHKTVADADAVFAFEGDLMAVGFLAGNRNCPVFADILAVCLDAEISERKTRYQGFGTEAVYDTAKVNNQEQPGCYAVQQFQDRYPKLKIVTIPDVTIYPFDYRQLGEIFTQSLSVPEASVGLHWFGGGELAQEWNRRLTEANYRQFDNTFTQAVKKVLCQ